MKVDPEEYKKWHVVYTRSRMEKKVYSNLEEQNIDCFLPVQKKLRQWKDRKKWVEMPLISGYCFVYINRKEYLKVLQTDHVVCYVTFDGRPAQIPQPQIDKLKQLVAQTDYEVNVSLETFRSGEKVEIISGPLLGVQGELVSMRGKDRFIIRIDQINTVFSVEVESENITILQQ